MEDKRVYLKKGTRLQFESGSLYEITGVPIGTGGGSIIYPAKRFVMKNGELYCDGSIYALKECYPASSYHSFIRNRTGEIVSENGSAEGIFYLKRVKEMQLDEYGITQWINRTSSRVLPVLESVEQLILAPPDQAPSFVRNTVTVMESLALKGRPLRYYINEYSQFTAAQTFHIIRQVLFALRDVHQAGFLHLDIQDGNLYVKGALEDESSLVTMIDFGCARMMKDGKTEPIKDCVIFTTVGFTAPEILFGNNGTLRLGPEADIYSVGCLMLYLLTGNRADTISLVNNHTRKYLTRFNLRKINCPRHLTDRMQEIIAHALESDPADRYHSAGEMLADVNEFIKAMEPNRSDLSAVSYDAFVCYRHGVIDSAAAVALQRGLEHFRPSFIKHRPFNRVFVDEGELSSCANFGEQIRSALKNARWLIVICSSSTPGSIWVRQEIDIFLEYHDRSRILAVLTEGEPENAFPPQLFGKSVKEQVMAADARGKNLKEILIRLNRDALLRVAAPMMGLTYDSLKQRKRIYAFQRAAAVASISAVLFGIFAVYAIYQNCQITRQTRIAMEQSEIAAEQTERANKEYKNALLNQGKVFAEQAQSALDKGDIMGAVELAVSALSTDPDGYTNMPAAEYVLTQALALYETENSNSAIAQSGSFRHDNYVDNFFVNDEEGILFSSDGDQIYLWDVEDCTLLQNIKPGIEGDYRITLQENLHDAEEKRLFFSSESSLGGTIQCYDYEKQEYIWITPVDLTKYVFHFSFSYWVRESDRLVCMYGPDLFVLDASDGRLLWQETFDIEDEVLVVSSSDGIKYGPMAASRDGNKILINLPRNYTGWSLWNVCWTENQDIVVLDLENYSRKVISPEYGIIGDLVWTDDGFLLLAGYRGVYCEYIVNHTFYVKNTAIFALVDAETGEKQWVQEMEFTGDTRMNIALTRYRDEEDLSAAMITYGNRCAVLNLNTGTVKENWEFSAPVCYLDFLDGNQGFWVVTEDGCYHKSFYDNQLQTIKIERYPNHLDKIVAGENDSFVLSHSAASSHSNIIVRYDFDRHDNNWHELCSIDLSYPSYDLDSGYLVMKRYDSPTIYYIKTNEDANSQLCRADIIQDKNSDIRIWENLGVYEMHGDEKLLLSCSYDDGHINSCIACVDLKTGRSDLLHIPIPREGYYSVDNGPVVGSEADPVIYYTDDNIIYSWDLEGEAVPIAELTNPVENSYCHINLIRPSCDGTKLLLEVWRYYKDKKAPDEYLAYLWDSDDGKLREIATLPSDYVESGFSNDHSLLWDRTGTRWSCETERGVCVYDVEGTLICFIPLLSDNYTIEGIDFPPEQNVLLVQYGTASEETVLAKYSLKDGKLIGSIDIEQFDSNEGEYTWNYPDEDTLMLTANAGTAEINISDSMLGLCAWIKNAPGYDSKTERFYTAENVSDGIEIGYFQRYTTEELVEMGNHMNGK